MPDDTPAHADLVEPEGVDAGPPVDAGRPVDAGVPVRHPPQEKAAEGSGHETQGQGHGELLSGPGSHNGMTETGPGQEMSAGEG